MTSTEEKLKIAEQELQERTKELHLLRDVSHIVDSAQSADEIIERIVNALPTAFRYPEQTVARITTNGEEVCTNAFTETEWTIAHDLYNDSRVIGSIEVSLLQNPVGPAEPFTREEKELLECVAERLSKVIERVWSEEILIHKTKEILSLSTPVTKVWENILILPLIGTLDSERTLQIMEQLLIEIRKTGSRYIIMDATGVGTIDSAVAANILKTSSAVKMLGSRMIFTGIKPEIAMTMVHLGIDLQDIITRATLQEGIEYALNAMGFAIVPKESLQTVR
jgi:anti-anti-sigma regulatory factor